MRRVLAAIAVLAAGAAVLAAMGAGGTSGNARVDAIFDNASFLIPGQDVKIAGARVGRVSGVTLTADNKARIEMEIDPAFTPFHADADCTIQPQSLIGEKFIDCAPGTTRAPALQPRDGHPPTVPLANTHAPVDLDLVLSTFRRPTNERLQILVNELGAGLAARGGEVNEAIRRANPALQETRRVLRIVSGDRRNLRELLQASDHVLAELARRRERIGDFISAGRRVGEDVAARQRQLGELVAELPPVLRQAEPALRSLERTAREGTPILRDLRAASPQLARLASQARPLTAAARPALTRLGSASAAGDDALRAAAPVVAKLRPFAALAKPTAGLVDELFQSLKQTGSVERLQDFVYQTTLTVARFDKISHVITPYLLVNTCGVYTATTAPGCSAHFAGGETTTRVPRRAARKHARKRPAAQNAPDGTPDATAPADGTQAPAGPQAPQGDGHPTIDIPGLPPITLPSIPGLGGGSGGKDDAKDPVGDLLGYLLR